MIKRLAVLGVGLIGGSLARALRRRGYCETIVGYGRQVAELEKARRLGVIDMIANSVPEAVAGADMVVLATPLGAFRSLFEAMNGHLAPDAVVTDVGSAKGCVVDTARSVFGEMPAYVVPGHPIAGTEHSGVEASFAELFAGRRVILTPTKETAAAALGRVRAMWETADAIVDELTVEAHDQILAATSHLPHLLAYALVNTLVDLDETEAIFRFAAGGFRDFTRIASSDPIMWHDICFANRHALLSVLDRYVEDLRQLRASIERGDGESLKNSFARAKRARDRFTFKGQAAE